MVKVSPNTPFKVYAKEMGQALQFLCLIHMIHQFGFPNQVFSAIFLSSIILVEFIYVDDCNLFVLDPPTNLDPSAVLLTLQCNMDIW